MMTTDNHTSSSPPAPNKARPLATLVMAAGKGTRLKSQLPKVLHPLFGVPLLVRVLQTLGALAQAQARPVGVILGHGRQQVTEALTGYGAHLSAWAPIVQDPQLGTGHAVQQALPHLAGFSGNVLILSGDVPLLQASSIQALLDAHTLGEAHLTVLTATLPDAGSYGRVITDAQGQVQRIVEAKDASPEELAVRRVNTGVYVLDWQHTCPLLSQLSNQNAQGEFYLTDLISLALSEGQLRVLALDIADPQEMLGVNSRADLALCHQVLNARSQARLMAEGVTIIDPNATWVAPEVRVGPDTVIYPGCVLEGDVLVGRDGVLGPHTQLNGLEGPVHLGDNVLVTSSVVAHATIEADTRVGPFAHLRQGVHLGASVRVGNFVEVKNSRVGEGSNAAHLAYLGDADIGAQVNMAAGSITANYDPVRKQKHRTKVADGAKVGCNAVLVAPVTVGENACVAAGSVITKDVAPWDLAIARPRQATLENWVATVQGQDTLAASNISLPS